MDVKILAAIITAIVGIVAIVALTKKTEIRTAFLRLRTEREDDDTESDRRGT